MVERKDILVAALKGLLAGVETSVIGKILCTFIAELASSDKSNLKELSEASPEQFEELLTQMELSATNAAVAAAGNEQVKKLVSNLIGLTDDKLQALTELTQQEFKDISLKLDRIDDTTTDTNKNTKEILSILKGQHPDKNSILRLLHSADDGSTEATKAIERFKENDDFNLGEAYLNSVINKVRLLEKTDVSDDVFIKREQELQAIIKAGVFYECTKKLDILITRKTPTSIDLGELLQIIQNDNELAIYFYQNNTNPAWIRLLKDAREFDKLGGSDAEVGVCEKVRARYLENVAEKSPEEVLEIFLGIKNLHRSVRGEFLNILLEMPPELAVKGVPIVHSYIKERERIIWYFVPRNAAKLMVHILEKYPNEAFAIAEELLEVWVPDEAKSGIREIEAKFRAFEYKMTVFEFFKKLWEADAFRATELLVNILNGYIDEIQKGKDYEVTMHWYILYERLDQIGEKYDRDILACLIGGICKAGEKVLNEQPDKSEQLLTILKDLKNQIFRRVEMHLLRSAPPGTQTDRINEIISNKEYRTNTGYKYEYKFLLRDQIGELEKRVVEEFLGGVDSKVLSGEDKENISKWFEDREDRKASEKDYEEILNMDKARELYLVKEVFPEEYEAYKEKSKKEEDEIAPKPRTSTARFVDPAEGTPLSVKEMVKMKPEEVVAYIVDEEKWKDVRPTIFFNTPEEALISAFGKAVQQKVDDYIKLDAGDLLRLKPKFLTYYFDGLWTGLREKEAGSESWKNILETSITIVNTNITREDYEGCFGAILSLVVEKLSKKFGFEYLELIWGIIEPLTKYQYNTDAIVKDEAEKDPYDECINCVQGKAFELAIRFGVGCKKEHPSYYEKTLSKELIEVLDYVVNKVELSKVVCVFGVWLIQLHWVEKDWFKENLDLILSEEDIKKWDAVWGSYVTWGRAAPEAFGLLAERGKYQKAIGRIGEQNSFKYRDDPDERLAEHLMIGFFNSWIDFDNELLKSFFAKAPKELRGYAARFLTTGFKDVKEDKEYDAAKRGEIANRLKLYWESRLDEISKEPEDNIEETQGFAKWVKDSLLSHEDTLNLLYKTLELSEGKIGERIDSVKFVEGISNAAKGNEIKALQCLKLAFNDDEMRMYSTIYKENLNPFIDSIINLPDSYPDIENIRKEAIALINTIGRMCPDLREVYGEFYNRLNKKIPT